jgi:ribosomal protein L37AE/L43A
MADPTEPVPPKRVARPVNSITSINVTLPSSPDKMLCERCGAEMYRMHAVWRCSSCGFKTDCCGW